MGLLIGLGDYGIGDLMDRAEALYELLLDLCQDQLSWENILEKPELYEKHEVYNKQEIIDMLNELSGVDLPINISDVRHLADELLARYTIEDVNALLLAKAPKIHTHVVADILDFEDHVRDLGIQIVPEVPTPAEEGVVYIIQSGTYFSFFVGTSGGGFIPLNAVSREEFAIGLASRQPLLTGTVNEFVLGDGTLIPRNKAAVGLGNVANLPPNLYPISDAQAVVNATKANDSEVVHKAGAETIAGQKTFITSPEVPLATEGQHAPNLAQVTGLISDAIEQGSLPYEIPFSLDTTWTWVHGLGFKPDFDIFVGGEPVGAKIEYTEDDDGTVFIYFTEPQEGYILVRP